MTYYHLCYRLIGLIPLLHELRLARALPPSFRGISIIWVLAHGNPVGQCKEPYALDGREEPRASSFNAEVARRTRHVNGCLSYHSGSTLTLLRANPVIDKALFIYENISEMLGSEKTITVTPSSS